MPYNHKELEKKWQEWWEKAQPWRAEEASSKPKFYCLVEFPYPSAVGLHAGHPRSYCALDAVVRKRRMEGFNVLYPMGWDAFGLPTENHALKTGRPPQDVTRENTDHFRKQLKALGLSFDWSREVNTTDPVYYKWTQWIFLKFYKAGLAYKAKTLINWCPKDKIGLANEEAAGGVCDRCGGPVEKREKEQWMIAITKYADRLLVDLDTVDYLPKIKKQQQDWIGKSEGAEIDFALVGISGQEHGKHNVRVFTTRPDTIFGATFVVISPELAKKWVDMGWQPSEEVRAYVTKAMLQKEEERTAEDREKTGVAAGIEAINPANGARIPVWVADYVLGHYGTGAIMAVPQHDDRDRAFAEKFGLPIVDEPLVDSDEVVKKVNGTKTVKFKLRDWVFSRQRYWGEPIPLIRCEACAARIKSEAVTVSFYDQNMFEALVSGRKTIETRALNPDEPERFFGNVKAGSFIRAINRVTNEERYFRVMASFEFQNLEALFGQPEEFLRAISSNKDEKPELEAWSKAYASYAPDYLARIEKHGLIAWKLEALIPGWVPDENLPVTLPDVERYEPTDSGESPLATIESFVNVACPNCGAAARRETDTMPNWAGSSWYFLAYIMMGMDQRIQFPLSNFQSALKRWMPVDLYNGGMEHTTLHLLYSRFWNKFLFDQGFAPTSEPYARRHSHGMILAEDGTKMSKSKGNGVDPDHVVEHYGADALRSYVMFMGPFEEAVPWNMNGLIGVRRFLDKVMALGDKIIPTASDDVVRVVHKTIKKVSEDIEAMKFNTAISQLMICVNTMQDAGGVSADLFGVFLKILFPFAPHVASELWEQRGNTTLLDTEAWPTFDPALVKDDVITLAVQVNGKLRGTIEIAPEAEQSEAEALARSNEQVSKWLQDVEIKKVVYVAGRMINFVL